MAKVALHEGRALVLLDGLDEVADALVRSRVARDVEAYALAHPPARVLVTSRPAGYPAVRLGMGFAHFEIGEFDDGQITAFLEGWERAMERPATDRAGGGSLARAVAGTPAIHRLAATPLLLTAIALLYETGTTLPSRRTDLYFYLLDVLAETWHQARALSGRPIDLWLGDLRLDRTLVERILAPVAYEARDGRRGGLLDTEWLRPRGAAYWKGYEGRSESEADALARDFLRLASEQVGLLAERAPERYAFTHPTLEEYLAARHLRGRRDRGAAAIARLYDPRWEEPIRLCCASLVGEEAEDLLTTIGEPGGRLPPLAAKLEPVLHRAVLVATLCLADEPDVAHGTKRRIAEGLQRILGQHGREPPRALVEAAAEAVRGLTGAAADALADALQTERMPWALSLLGSLAAASAAARGALVAALGDADVGVRWAAAGALGSAAGEPEVRRALVAALRDRDGTVRWAAARALWPLAAMERHGAPHPPVRRARRAARASTETAHRPSPSRAGKGNEGLGPPHRS